MFKINSLCALIGLLSFKVIQKLTDSEKEFKNVILPLKRKYNRKSKYTRIEKRSN